MSARKAPHRRDATIVAQCDDTRCLAVSYRFLSDIEANAKSHMQNDAYTVELGKVSNDPFNSKTIDSLKQTFRADLKSA